MPQSEINSIDRKILAALQENARISNVDLAETVGLSPSPCLRRVKMLEKQGVIDKYVCLLTQTQAGYTVRVFVNVRLERQVETALEEFESAVAKDLK